MYAYFAVHFQHSSSIFQMKILIFLSYHFRQFMLNFKKKNMLTFWKKMETPNYSNQIMTTS